MKLLTTSPKVSAVNTSSGFPFQSQTESRYETKYALRSKCFYKSRNRLRESSSYSSLILIKGHNLPHTDREMRQKSLQRALRKVCYLKKSPALPGNSVYL